MSNKYLYNYTIIIPVYFHNLCNKFSLKINKYKKAMLKYF